ncbi:MAG: hypothetical protein WCV71_01775 [Patescibacteria group bacterium]|jgi:hypothetical protein
MDLDKYLQQELENCGLYELTEADNQMLQEQGLLEFIFSKVSSKKFRKWKISDETSQQIKEAIKINITNNTPIKFTFPFGGYKLWSMPSAPEVDWAEFFMISYYCKYLAPIAKVYQPGVHFRFSSDDIIICQMNNVPTEDTEKYFKSFNILLANFKKFLPPNLRLEIVRVADMYSNAEEYQNELNIKILEQTQKYNNLSEADKERMLIMSKLNIKFQGVEDWTKLSKLEQEAKIKQGVILHNAHCDVSKRRSFVRSQDNVTVFSTPINRAVAIGTTRSSVAKFWAGFGVLQNKDNSYSNKILSPTQLAEANKGEYKTFDISLIPLDNFKKIRVYDQTLNFSN